MKYLQSTSRDVPDELRTYTYDDAARALRCHRGSITRMIREGKIERPEIDLGPTFKRFSAEQMKRITRGRGG